MINANEMAHTRISVWTKWVKFPQWQTVTTNPPVNTSTTLSLTGHSRVLLCPWTCLCVYLSLQSWEESSSIWMLTPVWAVSYLSWTWEAQSRDGWSGPGHSCVHANSSSGTLGAPPPLPLWKPCSLLHLFARTHILQWFPTREEPPQSPPPAQSSLS